jgi:hypothetical protein
MSESPKELFKYVIVSTKWGLFSVDEYFRPTSLPPLNFNSDLRLSNIYIRVTKVTTELTNGVKTNVVYCTTPHSRHLEALLYAYGFRTDLELFYEESRTWKVKSHEQS